MPRPPRSWTLEELKRDAAKARRHFVEDRRAALSREQALYSDWLERYQSLLCDLLVTSHDLRRLTGAVLEKREFLDFARYLAVPPISLDDLDTLTDSCFKDWVKQKTERGVRPKPRDFTAAAALISERLDTERAKWLAEKREPTPEEREAFTIGVASIPATSKLTTKRRGERSGGQEELTRKAITAAGYAGVKLPGTLANPVEEMSPGTFSLKSRKLAGTNMDVPVRLEDEHPTGQLFLAIECKVSNSSVNSRKRLLEVNGKRRKWDSAGLPHKFRTAAVLAGVFDVTRLIEVQDDGVLIFWEHRLEDLTAFLES
jgi:hypothetical protein